MMLPDFRRVKYQAGMRGNMETYIGVMSGWFYDAVVRQWSQALLRSSLQPSDKPTLATIYEAILDHRQRADLPTEFEQENGEDRHDWSVRTAAFAYRMLVQKASGVAAATLPF
ncbi:hypothetical protein [Streptomyces sp. NPDC053431]|uniref:hypothetical protein n=1 Tax=Streptomyces sp. NPDC053431 TaxID=3365703 RepID=UPI0037D6FDF3